MGLVVNQNQKTRCAIWQIASAILAPVDRDSALVLLRQRFGDLGGFMFAFVGKGSRSR